MVSNLISQSLRAISGILLLCAFTTSSAVAGDDGVGSELFPNLSLPSNLSGFGGEQESGEPVTWSATLQPTSQTTATLRVTAKLGGDYHIYSTTQPPGGPRRTVIKIASSGVKLTGKFTPDSAPKVGPSDVFGGLNVEEHAGEVTWTAPVQIDAPLSGDVKITVAALTCAEGRCVPSDETFTAFVQTASVPSLQRKSEAFRDGDYAVQWTAAVVPSGNSAAIEFTATPDDGYHIYVAAVDDAGSSTNFVITDKGDLKIGSPTTDALVIEKTLLPSMPKLRYHEGEVTWRLPIAAGEPASMGTKSVNGKIVYMACTDSSCLRPKAIEFIANVEIDDSGSIKIDGSNAIELVSTKPGDALDQAAETDWVDEVAMDDQAMAAPASGNIDSGDGSSGSGGGTGIKQESNNFAGNPGESNGEVTRSAQSLPLLLLFGFLGGIVLNVMPCVLPVIGLKVMSFINQGGEDRGRVLTLNLAYIAGVFVVFGLLATLAVFFGLGWGEQFQNFGLRIAATIGIFAFALSYLGTWEIPTPGLVSKAASSEAKREGIGGAFSKGAFATILATPCSAPLLGSVFAALIGAPALTVYLVFFAIAAGMASPFAVIGFVPAAAAYLPKPGAWMEKFKELMAFALLGAVAFFFYQFSDKDKVPVFITLIGVWFGCWIIGQVPAYDPIRKRLTAALSGIGVATAIGLFAFLYIGAPSKLDWQEYDDVRLANLQESGKTVMVDFSAKWCANCLVNLKRAIDTPEVARVVERLDAATIYADWTDYDPAITAKLHELNSNSIPVLAIYPAGDPENPIVLRDLISQSQVIEALESAGPSVPRVATR